MRVTSSKKIWECPLKGERVYGNVELLWFVPPDKTPQECTICQSCLPHLDDPTRYYIYKSSSTASVSCDYTPPMYFDVSIISDSVLFPKQKDNNTFVLPSHTDYQINVLLKNGFDSYFTIDQCLVGGKEVIIDKNIYINHGITLSGFKPDSKESFFFIGRLSYGGCPDIDKTNCTILLKLQRYKRVIKHPSWCGTGYELDSLGCSFGIPTYGFTVGGGKDDVFVKVGVQEEIQILLVCSDSDDEIKRKYKETIQKKREKKRGKIKRLREEIEKLEKYFK